MLVKHFVHTLDNEPERCLHRFRNLAEDSIVGLYPDGRNLHRLPRFQQFKPATAGLDVLTADFNCQLMPVLVITVFQYQRITDLDATIHHRIVDTWQIVNLHNDPVAGFCSLSCHILLLIVSGYSCTLTALPAYCTILPSGLLRFSGFGASLVTRTTLKRRSFSIPGNCPLRAENVRVFEASS